MKKTEADVIVVAMGLSGLAAAISAAEGGASVIGFEKQNTTGGAANMGMGPFAVESKIQRKHLINITKEEAFQKHMEYAHWNCDARLVHDYYWKSASTIDWLVDMGVDFVPSKYFPKSEATGHFVIPEGGGPSGPRAAGTMVKKMTNRAKELGVQILLETPAEKIIMENGKPAGVIGRIVDGEEIEARGRVVIVATGGAGRRTELYEKHINLKPDVDCSFFPVPGLDGDGIRMAWEAGAAKSRFTVDMSVGINDNFSHFGLEAAFRGKPELMVNLDGERFMNEEMAEMTTFTANAIARQKNRCAYVIFDRKKLNHLKKNGPECIDIVHGSDFYDHFDEEAAHALETDYPDFCMTDSIEELAKKTGINREGLKNTIEMYNRSCETGRDETMNKSAKYLWPVKTPKFYCCKVVLQTFGPLGGIKINHKTEVLNEAGEAIPGFYAAGTDACDIYGYDFMFYLPGNTMGFAINSGRIAGENAAEYINAV
jgi:fumarate reductase flavoprotein subunit